MPTLKPRVFVTLQPRQLGELQRLAHAREESLSRAASEMLEAGLEALEDEWLSEVGDARLRDFDLKKAIPYKQVKRRFAPKVSRRAR